MFTPKESQTDGRMGARYWWRHPLKALRLAVHGGISGLAPLERDEVCLPSDLRAILQAYTETGPNRTCANRHEYGGCYQRERVAALADWCLQRYEGDLVEIGACRGLCTRLLAAVAAKHGRKVIVVDPWVTGTQDCEGGEFEEFQKNTVEWREHLEVVRQVSDAPAVFAHLRGRSVAFAFVDGLHTFDACRSDFLLLRETTGLVVADDARYNVEVLRAARLRARQFGWRVIQPPEVREALLIPSLA